MSQMPPPGPGQPGGHPAPGAAYGWAQPAPNLNPGQYTYGAWSASPYGVTSAYRSTRGIAVALLVLLSVMALLSFLRVVAHIQRASLLQDVRDGEIGLFGLLSEVEEADNFVAGAVLLWVVGVLATGVVFIVWQYRHTTNAQVLRGGAEGLGPGWAIGGWFIPVANLVLPCIQIFGASRPSDPGLPLPPQQSMRRGAGSGLVVWWAVLFGVAGLVERAGGFRFPSTDELRFDDAVADALAADRLVALGSLIHVGAAVLAAVMVWQLTDRQDRRAAALALMPGAGPAAVAGQMWPSTPTPTAPVWGAPSPQQAHPQPGYAGGAWQPQRSDPPPTAESSDNVPPVGPWAPPGQTGERR